MAQPLLRDGIGRHTHILKRLERPPAAGGICVPRWSNASGCISIARRTIPQRFRRLQAEAQARGSFSPESPVLALRPNRRLLRPSVKTN